MYLRSEGQISGTSQGYGCGIKEEAMDLATDDILTWDNSRFCWSTTPPEGVNQVRVLRITDEFAIVVDQWGVESKINLGKIRE